jgi:hypothetical protein
VFAKTQDNLERPPEGDGFWEGFWEALRESESPESGQSETDVTKVKHELASKNSYAEHYEFRINGLRGPCRLRSPSGESIHSEDPEPLTVFNAVDDSLQLNAGSDSGPPQLHGQQNHEAALRAESTYSKLSPVQDDLPLPEMVSVPVTPTSTKPVNASTSEAFVDIPASPSSQGQDKVEPGPQDGLGMANKTYAQQRTDTPPVFGGSQPRVTFGVMIMTSLFELLQRGMLSLQQMMVKSPLPDGHVRISWNCVSVLVSFKITAECLHNPDLWRGAI